MTPTLSVAVDQVRFTWLGPLAEPAVTDGVEGGWVSAAGAAGVLPATAKVTMAKLLPEALVAVRR